MGEKRIKSLKTERACDAIRADVADPSSGVKRVGPDARNRGAANDEISGARTARSGDAAGDGALPVDDFAFARKGS